MQSLPVVFSRSNKPFCWLIRLGTLSSWSHCGIIDGDYVIDATLASGVRRIPFSEWKTHYTKYEIVKFPVKNTKESIAFARNQIGKKYDPLGIISLVIHRNIEDRNKYFCSELVAATVGIKYKPWRLSPQFLKMIHKCIEGWIK